MPPAVFDEAVAGNHRERTRDGCPRLLLGPPVNDHRAAGLSRLREGLPRQPLARGHQLVQGKALVRPCGPVVEERRLDLRHPGPVRIGFGRHVLPGVASRSYGREEPVELATGRRVDVHDVQWRARGGRRLDRFLQPGQPAPHVNVGRYTTFSSHTKHALDL